jgi:diguanylate cyclase (GGDEF)-like protein
VVAPRERALLEDTLCGITLERDAATWVACPEGQTPPTHLGIAAAAYLGVPIWLGPVPYGTLSFAGVEPRDRAFDQGDRDCLEVMASWLSLDLRLQRTLDELDQAQKKLRGFVRMDPLTELLNRDAVLRSFERYAERAGFTGTSLACLVVGIDGLHLINEDFGDATGDRVLRAVATRVRDSLRPSDVAGRVGDAEFLAILPEANLDDAERVAERISRSVELLIVNAKEEAFGLTVSIAVSRVPLGRTNVAEVLAEAEILLRKSRASGGGRIAVNTKVG